MGKIIYSAIISVLLAFSQSAFTRANQDHTCQGGHNCNTGGGGDARSESTARANADSHSSSNSQSNASANQHQGQAQSQGQITIVDITVPDNSAGASQVSGGPVSARGGSGGSATSHGGSGGAGGHGGEGGEGGQGGDGGSGGVGNSGDVVGGDTVVNVSEDSDTNIVYEDTVVANTAASVYTEYCQRGGSGQTEKFGFSVVNSDQFCDHIRMADRALLAWQQCKEAPSLCTDRQLANYKSFYHEHMADADLLVGGTKYTGFLGRIFDQLSIPAAVLALILM